MHPYEESRKRARKRWRQSEKGKAWDKAYSHRDYVKAYNGVDVLTIMQTDKDIKRHAYEMIKKRGGKNE